MDQEKEREGRDRPQSRLFASLRQDKFSSPFEKILAAFREGTGDVPCAALHWKGFEKDGVKRRNLSEPIHPAGLEARGYCTLW
ncbi:hypothetical protein VYU27_002599 [Nannochloropsis oceanica]